MIERFTMLAAEVLAYTGVSAASGAAPANTTHARLMPAGAGFGVHVRQGAAPVAVVADMLIGTGGDGIVIRIAAGQKIAAIQDSAGGNLSIQWLQVNPTTQSGNYDPGLPP